MVYAQANAEMTFRKWEQVKMSKAQIMEELKNHGFSPEEITSICEEYCRHRVSKRNTQGWLLMGIGGFLGLVSCVLTMVDPAPDFRGLFMYGFTSVAVTMAFYGCYLVMEKGGDE